MQGTQIFTSLSWNDLWFLAEGAFRTIELTFWSALFGTAVGLMLGVARASLTRSSVALIGIYIDFARSIPLLVQFILFNSFVAVIGYPLDSFTVGVLVLTFYIGAYMCEVVRAGIDAVPRFTRRAARSLGMTWLQDCRYVVFPLGLRAMLPAWIGLIIGLVKDTSLISVIGYIELLRAGQIVITRTQKPLLVLGAVGLIYFVICSPLSRFGKRLEKRLTQ